MDILHSQSSGKYRRIFYYVVIPAVSGYLFLWDRWDFHKRQEMKKTSCDIVANINFRNPIDGGRNGPTPNNFFNCIFSFQEKNYDCRLLLEEGIGSINPGDTVKYVPIVFFRPDLIKGLLKIGDTFSLRESRIIAEGRIVNISSIS
jgi:hypothetical protein